MNSRIFLGFVEHKRLKPVQHSFRYPLYVYSFDLSELETLDRTLPLFGYNRVRPVSLHDADYLEEGKRTIRNKLFRYLRASNCGDTIAQVILVTSARYFGRVFNPVSFYYCFADDGQFLCAVAEVNNTYGERHVYVLNQPQEPVSGFLGHYTAEKEFHVSPFNDMIGTYEFLFSDIRRELDIQIWIHRDGETAFQARLWGRPVALTAKTQLKVVLRHPLVPQLTMSRILREAAKLYFRRKLPMYDKPVPTSLMTIRRNPPTFLQNRCMKFLQKLFGQLRRGCLTLNLPDGEVQIFGDMSAPLKAEITVNDYRFFSRSVFGGEVGFGEAYTAGDWDSSDLTAVIRLFIENREVVCDGAFRTAWISRFLNRLAHLKRKNTLSCSPKNIQAHYDLSNEFFQVFLDPTMTYSCGLYLSPEDDLETAQKNKLQSIIRKAAIDSSDHVLEIGCGWGSFAMEAVTTTGCRVTGITISEAQYTLAKERIRKAGLEDQITILLQDYREIQGSFDKIVSIEMLEGVGHKYFGTFFQCCDRLLKTNGLLILQVITCPDQGYESYRKECGWIPRHIFPGGLLPSLTALCSAMTASSSFIVEDLENIGIHYARTLREWRTRFLAGIDRVSQLGFDREFQRKWLYYLSLCEAGFATRTQNDLQLVLTRINNTRLNNFKPQREKGANVESC